MTRLERLKDDIKAVCDCGNYRDGIYHTLLNWEEYEEDHYTKEEISKAIDEMVESEILAEGHPCSHYHSDSIHVVEWQPNTCQDMNEEKARISQGLPPDGHAGFLRQEKAEKAVEENPEKYLDKDGKRIDHYFYDEGNGQRRSMSLVCWDLWGEQEQKEKRKEMDAEYERRFGCISK